jgi:hypothetical protein
MAQTEKPKDYYEKYCSKCEHEDVAAGDEPCKECIEWLFEECKKNPTYTGWRKYPNFKKRK